MQGEIKHNEDGTDNGRNRCPGGMQRPGRLFPAVSPQDMISSDLILQVHTRTHPPIGRRWSARKL